MGRPLVRSGLFQADLLTSCGNTSMAGSLGSTGVTRLPRYYGPLRLPTRSDGGYVFPPFVGCVVRPDHRRPIGPPRFSADLSAPAVPNHPGESGRCAYSFHHDRHETSPHPEGWSLSTRIHEAESGSLALRLAPLPFEASPPWIAPGGARLATWRTSTYHDQYLSTDEISQD